MAVNFHFCVTKEVSLASRAGRMVSALEVQLMKRAVHEAALAMMPLGLLRRLFDWQKVAVQEVTVLMD